MRFPLDLEAHLTDDDTNVLQRISKHETHIPYGKHCGAFGVERAHDVHAGIDLYALDGEDVFAITDGIVRAVFPFTGKDANCPWWLDTMAVAVEDEDGVWLYGEIQPNSTLKPGLPVHEGDHIGTVSRVLRNFKGRPTSMLHLERYISGTTEFAPIWYIGCAQPLSLVDPTELLCHFDSFLEWQRWEDDQRYE